MQAIVLTLLLGAALVQDKQEPAKPVQGRDEIVKQDIENAIKKLGSERYTESYVAREELVELGRRAVPAVVAELTQKDVKPPVKRALCEILGAIREPRPDAVKALVDRLKDTDEYGTSIAAAAARALASIADDSAAAPLLEVLKSRAVETDKVLKYETVRALGILRVAEASEPLRKALEDKKPASVSDDDQDAPTIAAAAADALGLLRARDAVEDLGKLLADLTNDPRSGQHLGVHAARALQRILEHELRGKAAKDEPRAGVLAGDPEEIKKTHEAWKTWWESHKAKKDIEETRSRIGKVAEAVEKFKKEQGNFPAILDHLKVKPEKAQNWPKDGYYAGDLKDAWGRPLLYRQPGTGADFDVVSYGKDGRTWGGGDNADLWNHEKWKEAKKAETRKAIEDAAKVVEQFKADNGRYPEKLVDLVARPSYTVPKWPEKGYLQAVPKDAYDNYLQYHVGRTPGADFDLISLGADGAEGGTGENEDIWNHDKRPPKKEEPKKDDKK
jgi:type II secretion system protein G